MGAKPTDLFVGVVEFFSVLLPGAFLTFAFQMLPATRVFGTVLPALHESGERWIAFGFLSYLVGHLVFQIGSLLDTSYDRFVRPRKARDTGDRLYLLARKLKAERDLIDDAVINTFKWCNAYIRTHSDSAIAVIDSLEASHKFFRSMVVAFLSFALLCAVNPNLGKSRLASVMVSLALAVVSYWRFSELRWKMTQANYLYYVQLKNTPDEASS
jgi:hypothetical protein